MGLLARASFARGWMPDADKVNGPVEALLRMDNLTLDEMGVIALRQGSAVLETLADQDIHSLFTSVIYGTRHRMTGAGDYVYANGSRIAGPMNYTGDIAFGSHLGQILFARGTSALRYDGSTVQSWGVPMTGPRPTIVALPADSKLFASGQSTEAPAFYAGLNTTIAFVTGEDNTANAAIKMTPDPATGLGTITKGWLAAQDFTAYDGGQVGTDTDLIEMWVYVTAPSDLLTLAIQVDIAPTAINNVQGDYFTYTVANAVAVPIVPHAPSGVTTIDNVPLTAIQAGATNAQIQQMALNAGTPLSQLTPSAPVANAGWNRLKIPRGSFARIGATNGLGWNTVKSIRLITQTVAGHPVAFQSIGLYGGAQRPLTGTTFRWVYVYASNTGTYVGLSAPSAPSAITTLEVEGAAMTAPADGSRAANVNEIWFFRGGGTLDQFYLAGKATAVGGNGAYTVDDTTNDIDLLLQDIPLVPDNGPPPSSMVSIAGPYYDRMMCLTSVALYPSRRLNPDSFAAGQVINIAGGEEVCYWVHKALGGLYVGTSKDIYRIDGTGSELPDGTIDFTKTPVNVDHPPINDGVAQDGTQLIYVSDTGWRAFTGASSTALGGSTSLLYRGQTRHGVSPVNLATGRFRGVIVKGQLACLTPEGASAASSPVIYRNVAPASMLDAYNGANHWYRHVYPNAFRSLHREPDGTVLAGDTVGHVWQVDTGTQDQGAPIPITLWTKCDDDAKPLQRKDPWDVRVHVGTGGLNGFVQLYFDGSDTFTAQFVANHATEGYVGFSLRDVLAATTGAFRQVQLRVTGSFAAFTWYDYGIGYRERPVLSYFAEPKPQTPSAVRRRFSGIQIIIDTLSGPATVTPMLDAVAQAPILVTTTDALAHSLTFPAVVGRDLWARVEKLDGFELYEMTPRILEELPAVAQGLLPRSLAGSPGQKMCSGMQVRLCTLGVPRALTLYLDGVPQDAYTVTTDAIEANDFTIALPAPVRCTEIALSSDGDIELYGATPLITSRRPLGVRAWDSGPIDIGGHGELVWLRRLYLKVNAEAPLTIVAYMDDVVKGTQIVPITPGVDTIVPVDFGRACAGRQPRLVVTSAAPFNPWTIRVERRITGGVTDRPSITIPVSLGV